MRLLAETVPVTLTILPRTHPATTSTPKTRILGDTTNRRPFLPHHLHPTQRDWLRRNLDPTRTDLVCLVNYGPAPLIIGWTAQNTSAH